MFDCKTLNELLLQEGMKLIQLAIENASTVEDCTVYSMAKEKKAADKLDGYLSDWEEFDGFTGGFGGGKFTLIGGNTSKGKTTCVLNIMAALMRIVPVFYWSGEEKDTEIRAGLDQIMGGPVAMKEVITDSKKTYNLLDRRYTEAMDSFYENRMFWFSDKKLDNPTADVYFRKAEFAIQRHDCKVVVFDNLMAFSSGQNSDDYLQTQGDFAKKCKRFAIKHDVHVFLVAHNRKFSSFESSSKSTKALEAPTTDDVEGSAKITNWADFVVQVWKVTEIAKQAHAEELGETSTVLNLCKVRGNHKKIIGRFRFCTTSQRIYELKDPNSQYRKFGWEPEELVKCIDSFLESTPPIPYSEARKIPTDPRAVDLDLSADEIATF